LKKDLVEGELEKTMSLSEELETTERWCKEVLLPNSLDSLWYERLGETARRKSALDVAISKFTNATDLDNPTISSIKGLAESYYENDELLSACSSMEKALSMVKEAESPDKDELTSIYLRLASWYIQLQQPERAVTHYEQALTVDPTNQDALNGILVTRLDSGPEEKTQDYIVTMSKLDSKEPNLSQLASILLSLADDFSYGGPLRNLIVICGSRQTCMTALLEAMDQAINAAREQKIEFKLQVLLLHRGLAAVYNDQQNDQSLSQAVSFFTDCYNITDQNIRRDYDDDLPWKYISFHRIIIHQLSLHYFEQSTKLQNSHTILSKLTELSQSFRLSGISGLIPADIFLAKYHIQRGDQVAAKEQVRQYMRMSIDNLSDETDENDYWAAYTLFRCLSAIGDDLNALTAWSLLEPVETDIITRSLKLEMGPKQWLVDELTELVKTQCPLGATQVQRVKTVQTELEARLAAFSQETDQSDNSDTKGEIQKALAVLESALTPKTNLADGASEQASISPLDSKDIAKKFDYTCDGCGKSWDFNNALNTCKYCWNIGFCDDCLSLLKTGKLKRFVCSSNHDWQAIPKWNPRGNTAARDGTVQIRGDLVDGVRMGGETVPFEEWLNLLKTDWGL
jgi:tetratricopeptide (TPR) repeat protein